MPTANADVLPQDVASALGRRSGEARRARSEAVKRLVAITREAQGLPRTVTDVEVLERVATLIAGRPDAL